MRSMSSDYIFSIRTERYQSMMNNQSTILEYICYGFVNCFGRFFDKLEDMLITPCCCSNLLSITYQEYLDQIKLIDFEDEDNECIICLELYELKDKISFLDCAHIFHTDCIKTWINKKKSCPMCREKVYSF